MILLAILIAYSGAVSATNVKGSGEFLFDSPLSAPFKSNTLYRVSGEFKADQQGRMLIGLRIKPKNNAPFFRRVCPLNVSTEWERQEFPLFLPEDAPVDGREAPVFIGWEKGSSLQRVEYRDLKFEEVRQPKTERAPGYWATTGKNGFFNSSFELGLASHHYRAGIEYRLGSTEPAVTIDDTVAWHGKCSVKLDNRDFGRRLEFVTSAGGCDPRAKSAMISGYVRADRPVKAEIIVRDVVSDSPHCKNDWSGARAIIDIGTKWSRFETRVSHDDKHGKYAIHLSFKDRATVWVDAVQVEDGYKATAYEPAAPVEAAMVPDDQVFVRERQGFWKRLRGWFGKNARGGKIEDQGGVELRAIAYTQNVAKASFVTDCGASEMDLSAGMAVTRRLEFTPQRYGAFTVNGTFTCSLGSGRVYPFDYAVVGPQAPWKGGFAAGLNAATGAAIEDYYQNVTIDKFVTSFEFADGFGIDDYFRMLALSGCRILRLHDCAIWWFNLEPEKGRYEWDILDTVVDECRKWGIEPLVVFGNGPVTSRRVANRDKLANWFVRKRSEPRPSGWGKIHQCYLPNPDDWRDFYTAMVKRYRGRIKYYEVVNEPNGTMANPDDYMRYLKLSYSIVRENDPAAKVIGICSTGDYGSNTAAFVKEIGDRGGFDYFDIMSFHPYQGRLDCTSREDAEAQLVQIRKLVDSFAPGKPILQDELYYLSTAPEHDIYGRPRDDPGLSSNWPAGHLVRRGAIDLAGGVIGSVSITGRQLRRIDRGYPGSAAIEHTCFGWNPNDRFVAANAFARFLNDAVFAGKPKLPKGMNGFDFTDRDGKSVKLRWMRYAGKTAEIEVPEGMTAFDIYGNQLVGRKLTLTDEPVYLK